MDKGGTNQKILLGASLLAVAIIGIFVISLAMQEEQFSSTQSEIKESIQKEISKSPQITGIHAQTICKIIESYCSDQKSFHATLDPSDGYTKFRHTTPNGIQYDFRIIDDVLEYKTNQNPEQWISYEDQWTWDHDDKAGDEATDYSKYVHVRQFSGDELGYYERWCNVFDGDWLDEAYQCGFKDDQDYKAAQKDLDQVLRPSIEGEKAEIFCEILHKECNERTIFKANYDPRTDVTHYDGFVEGLGGIAIRMIDNKISYANSYNADTWFEWAHFPEILEDPNLQDGEALSPSQESKSFKIIQYGMFDAEDDGNLVDQLYVGETYWFYLEYQNELDARQKVRTFVTMQDKDTGDILRKTDAHGFEKPKERTGHGFEWIPEYEGEFKMKGEFRTLDDPLVSAVIPQYDFVVVEKP